MLKTRIKSGLNSKLYYSQEHKETTLIFLTFYIFFRKYKKIYYLMIYDKFVCLSF